MAERTNSPAGTTSWVGPDSTIVPVEPDFSQAWERGYEHVCQEGTKLRQLRESVGLSRADVEALSDGVLVEPRLEMLEDYACIPDVDELATLARIFAAQAPRKMQTGRPGASVMAVGTPGDLLDFLLTASDPRGGFDIDG